ncbi:hypothetical protein [Pseudonocardia abyssalis]|uniref:Uncharacterized protein n=1 Tax=Pseudonocardia abyssalis TaxID=2792008 RepID=A0ABS6UP55_9PSEU|nr:hypothetical protein [Pseudonocardia abyssalis]MBW0119253.1 hypothetical protein [Pseudonocardia abyssalis]MBW0134030.1 hypothetical protein [Pseudonocardia abyssalis]
MFACAPSSGWCAAVHRLRDAGRRGGGPRTVPDGTGSPEPDGVLPIGAGELALADADRRVCYGVAGEAGGALQQPLWRALPAVAQDRSVVVDDDVRYLDAGPVAAGAVLTTALGG